MEPRPDTENTIPCNTPVANDRMWDIVLKEAEESMHEKNWALNLAFIY